MTVDRGADWHTHSDLTDGADPWETMAAAAVEAGLHTLCATDHVRRDTTWLPEYVVRVRALDGASDLRVLCGVEAKILDTAGRLDLPGALPPLDRVLVADHQVPGPDGPLHPRVVAEAVTAGARRASDVVDDLVTATCAAIQGAPVPVHVAHLFSVLPKCGISEDAVEVDHLRSLAQACRASGAAVEINEKWCCPGPRVLQVLLGEGVTLVAGSDAHRAADVGRWRYLDDVEPRLVQARS